MVLTMGHRMSWGSPGVGVCALTRPSSPQATATSYSTSVQCWAHTSSWRRCWLIWDLAEPGWPCRNRRWAWQAQWPHWAWQWLGTCSSLLLSQLPYFGLPVRAPCCRVARWRGIQRPNYSEAPALSLPWREAEARRPPPAPAPRAGEEPRPRPDKTGALLSLEPRGVAEERVRRSEGRGEERRGAGRLVESRRVREGALDGAGGSAEGLRGEVRVSRLELPHLPLKAGMGRCWALSSGPISGAPGLSAQPRQELT